MTETTAPFARLAAAAQAYEQAQQDKQQRKVEREIEMDKKRKAARVDWLRQTLLNLGINADVNDTYAEIDGFRFSIASGMAEELYHQQGFGANPFDPALWLPRPLEQVRFDLQIRNLNLPSMYSADRPGVYSHIPYCESVRRVTIVGSGYWEQTAAEVLQAIEYLKNEQAEAPARKAKIDADYAAEQDRLQQQRDEQEERRAQAEAEYAERHARNEQIRLAREAREAQLRAEVAARFGVSADAYDFIIEALANELQRRRYTTYEE